MDISRNGKFERINSENEIRNTALGLFYYFIILFLLFYCNFLLSFSTLLKAEARGRKSLFWNALNFFFASTSVEVFRSSRNTISFLYNTRYWVYQYFIRSKYWNKFAPSQNLLFFSRILLTYTQLSPDHWGKYRRGTFPDTLSLLPYIFHFFHYFLQQQYTAQRNHTQGKKARNLQTIDWLDDVFKWSQEKLNVSCWDARFFTFRLAMF